MVKQAGTKAYTPELERRLEPEYQRFMERAAEVRWSPRDIAYDQIDYQALTIGDLFAVFVTLHIENYSDVYTRLLIQHFGDAPLLKSFIENWEREEENHARALELYLIQAGMPIEELKANYAKVDKADFPFPSRDQTGLNVFVFLQELLTREMYVKMLKACKEPVLSDILKRIVRDEERHYRFYKHALETRFELDREDTLRQFGAILRTFGMPRTMFQQRAMTDKLMEYYRYSNADIAQIAKPVLKMLEVESSLWLERFPKMQKAWIMRRAAFKLVQSPYIWRHIGVSMVNILKKRGWDIRKWGLEFSASGEEAKEYVQSVVERLHALLTLNQNQALKSRSMTVLRPSVRA